MKSLKEYITESEQWMSTPSEGDDFAIELPDEVLIETYIIEVADNCILLDSTPEINAALSEWAMLEDTDEGDSGVILEDQGAGQQLEKAIADAPVKPIANMEEGAMKDWLWKEAESLDRDAFISNAAEYGMTPEEAAEWWDSINGVDEAKYQGREVPLGKPMKGDVKKSKVYVRDPATGNVKKVNFGDKTMKIKKSNPARRKSFRARHNCANPGPRTKARYWSCRAW